MTDYSKYKESAFTHEEMQPMIIETDMTDIVERLRDKLPMVHDGEGMIVDDDAVLDTLSKAADEIERLRGALRHYVSECDCNGGTYHEEDHITGKTLVKDCPKCEAARAALGEKE